MGSYVRRYHETGAFVVSAGVDNKKPAEAIRVILKELQKITVAPVSADELRRAKDFYLGQLELGLENSMNQMLWAGESAVTLNRCRSTEEILDRVERVTPDDIQKVAKSLFKDESLNMALVGPKQSEKEFGALLTLQA